MLNKLKPLSQYNKKKSNSNYKELYILAKQNLYPKKSYSIVKLDSIQEIKKRNS